MTTTDLARRSTSAVAVPEPTPEPAQPAKRGVGSFEIIAIALILAFLVGLAYSLGQPTPN